MTASNDIKPPCKRNKKSKFISRCLTRDPFLPCTYVNYSLILVMFAVAHPRPPSLLSPWRADAEPGDLWPSETNFTKIGKIRGQAVSPVRINSFDRKLHRYKHTPVHGNVKCCWTTAVPSRLSVTVASDKFQHHKDGKQGEPRCRRTNLERHRWEMCRITTEHHIKHLQINWHIFIILANDFVSHLSKFFTKFH